MGYQYFHGFFTINKYWKMIFIECVHFFQISICYKRGVPIQFTMETPYIFYIYKIKCGRFGSQTLHLNNINFLLSALLIPHDSHTSWQYLRHIDISSHLSPIFDCSANFSALSTLYTPHWFCVPNRFKILHPLPLVIPGT